MSAETARTGPRGGLRRGRGVTCLLAVDGSAVHEGQATDTGRAPEAVLLFVPRSRHATWWKLVVGVVFAVLGTLLFVKVIGGSSGPRTTTALSPTSATVLDEVTDVPSSTYDDVGVHSSTVPVVAPELLHGARPPRDARALGACGADRALRRSGVQLLQRRGALAADRWRCRGSATSARSTTSSRRRSTSHRTRRRSASTASTTAAPTSCCAPTRSPPTWSGTEGYKPLMERASALRRLRAPARAPVDVPVRRRRERGPGARGRPEPDHLRRGEPRPGRGRARRPNRTR